MTMVCASCKTADSCSLTWPSVLASLEGTLRSAYGFDDEDLLDEEEVPVVVVHADSANNAELKVVFASTGFERDLGFEAGEVLGEDCFDVLGLRGDSACGSLNREVAEELDRFVSETSGRRAEALSSEALPLLQVLVTCDTGGIPAWKLLDVLDIDDAAAEDDGGCLIALVLLPIRAPVVLAEGDLGVAYVNMVREELSSFVSRMPALFRQERRLDQNEDEEMEREVSQDAGMPRDSRILAQEFARKTITHIHEDAWEGSHYVPKFGWHAVEEFHRSGGPEAVRSLMVGELASAWHSSEKEADEIRDFDKCRDAEDVPWCVTDPNGVDCPVVYASKAFEKTSGYSRPWLLGRNCRVLQIRRQETNVVVNGTELLTIRRFCEGRTGQLVVFLLNEKADGRPLWNLLYLRHVHVQAEEGAQQSHYIFALLHDMYVQKDALDAMICQELVGRGTMEAVLKALRVEFALEAESLDISERSLAEVAEEVSLRWLRQVGDRVAIFFEHRHFVPQFGTSMASPFKGVWQNFVDVHEELLRGRAQFSDPTLQQLKDNKDESALLLVMDPFAMDCPVVFFSRAMAQATGFLEAFAIGRNWRFLHPVTEVVGEALNGRALARLCPLTAKSNKRSIGATEVALLLLCRSKSNDQFWTLVHFNLIGFVGRRFLLATFTMFPDVPMHGMLKDGDALESLNQTNQEGLKEWLRNLAPALIRVHGHLRTQEKAHQLHAHGQLEEHVRTMAKIASEGLVGCFMSVKDGAVAGLDVTDASSHAAPSRMWNRAAQPSPRASRSAASTTSKGASNVTNSSPKAIMQAKDLIDELELPAVPQAQCWRRVQRSCSPPHLGAALSPDCEDHVESVAGPSRRGSPPELMLEGHHQPSSPVLTPSHAPHFLAPISPMSPVAAPECPRQPLPERRFVRNTIKASQPGSPASPATSCMALDSGVESAACGGGASESSPTSSRLPPSEVLLAEASMKLIQRGWSQAAVAEIFGIEDTVLTSCLAQRSTDADTLRR